MGATDDYRAASLDQWSRSAEGWSRHIDFVDAGEREVTHWLLSAAAPASGERVLELACGPGTVGLEIAPVVEPGGGVVLSDFAEPMLDVARRRAEERELENVEFRVIDAERIDLPEESVDAVVCRFGFMLMADPGAAFGEARRVLRPGGRIALAVWGAAERNPWASGPMLALIETLGTPPPEPGAPGIFALADAERVRSLLEGAGFEAVRVDELESSRSFGSFQEWWGVMSDLAAPLRDMTAALDDRQREQVHERMRSIAAPFTGDDGEIAFPAAAVCATARAG